MIRKIKFFLLCFIFYISFLSCNSNVKWQNSFQNGMSIVLQIDSKGDSKSDEMNLNKIKKRIGLRLKDLGVPSNHQIIKIDTTNRTILIQLPYNEYNQKAVYIISTFSFLEFRLASDDATLLQKALVGDVPDGFEINYANKKPLLINKDVLLDGSDLKSVNVELDQNGVGTYHVNMEFTDTGKEKLASVTQNNVGKRLVILLDGEVIMAPRVKEPITTGLVMIKRGLSYDEARVLSIPLLAGSSPSRVHFIKAEHITKENWQGQ